MDSKNTHLYNHPNDRTCLFGSQQRKRLSRPQKPPSKLYYHRLNTNPSTKAILSPGLYRPQTPEPVLQSQYRRFTPHAPVEIAPLDPSRWEADLNARIYERKMQVSAEPDFYQNWNRRRAWMSMIAKDMQSRTDPYLQPVSEHGTFAQALEKHNGEPPVVVNF